MMALEGELDGPRPAKPGDQEIGGGAVAVHNRPANEIIDSCIESILCHELRQRLHGETQIVLPDDHRIGQPPLATVDRVHDRDCHEQLHDTLKREPLVSIDARNPRRVLTQTPTARRIRASHLPSAFGDRRAEETGRKPASPRLTMAHNSRVPQAISPFSNRILIGRFSSHEQVSRITIVQRDGNDLLDKRRLGPGIRFARLGELVPSSSAKLCFNRSYSRAASA